MTEHSHDEHRMYARLAKSEEADILAQFGEQYRRYMQSVPAFVPKPGHDQP